MNAPLGRSASVLVLVVVMNMSRLEPARGESPGEGNASGRELFVRHWKPSDPDEGQGDGLGPMFNARSCAACHEQGGVGGGGPVENNVELLAVSGVKVRPRGLRHFASNLVKIHPGFRAGQGGARSSLVLHRFGTDPRYPDWREKLIGKRRHRAPVEKLTKGRGLHLSRRNTPALFGAGLIDRIDKQTLEQVAEEQARQFPGISGRVPPAGEDIGRFGWRGQTATLREFVLTACATELGLQVVAQSQAVDPLNPEYASNQVDLTEQQCDALIAFVAALPAPTRIQPEDPFDIAMTENGKSLFTAVGCAACHVADLGPIEALYSDLLLHDMGPVLADPVPANAEGMFASTVQESSGGAYSGGSITSLSELASSAQREWRTPPLWGVADSAPYLHDGRAATMEEAIALHGGEAEVVRRRYFSLSPRERARVVAFLQTLRAPRSD